MAKKIPVPLFVEALEELKSSGTPFVFARILTWASNGEPESYEDLEGWDCIATKPRTPGDYAVLGAEGKIEVCCNVPEKGDAGTRVTKRNVIEQLELSRTAAPGEASLGNQARAISGAWQDLTNTMVASFKSEREYVDRLRAENDELRSQIKDLQCEIKIAASSEGDSTEFLMELMPLGMKLLEVFSEKSQREAFANFASRFLRKIPAERAAEFEPVLREVASDLPKTN